MFFEKGLHHIHRDGEEGGGVVLRGDLGERLEVA